MNVTITPVSCLSCTICAAQCPQQSKAGVQSRISILDRDARLSNHNKIVFWSGVRTLCPERFLRFCTPYPERFLRFCTPYPERFLRFWSRIPGAIQKKVFEVLYPLPGKVFEVLHPLPGEVFEVLHPLPGGVFEVLVPNTRRYPKCPPPRIPGAIQSARHPEYPVLSKVHFG